MATTTNSSIKVKPDGRERLDARNRIGALSWMKEAVCGRIAIASARGAQTSRPDDAVPVRDVLRG
jgi:hypothetical protein